jgi:hypothetical protein
MTFSVRSRWAGPGPERTGDRPAQRRYRGEDRLRTQSDGAVSALAGPSDSGGRHSQGKPQRRSRAAVQVRLHVGYYAPPTSWPHCARLTRDAVPSHLSLRRQPRASEQGGRGRRPATRRRYDPLSASLACRSRRLNDRRSQHAACNCMHSVQGVLLADNQITLADEACRSTPRHPHRPPTRPPSAQERRG